jgi:two-component system heavy metal sensor histidine kinase CusS
LRPGSITTRISALFACLLVLVLSVMGYLIHAAVTHHFEEQDRMAISGKLALVQNILDEPSGEDRLQVIRRKLVDALVGHHELSLQVIDARADVVFVTPHFHLPSTLFANVREYTPKASLSLLPVEVQSHHYRATVVTLLSRSDQQSYRVLIALDVGHHQHFLEGFRARLVIVGSSGLIIMILLGWLVARHGLSPLREMATIAEGVSAQRIQERLPAAHLPAELHSLAKSFNEMLDRIEDALARLSAFSGDIAHELRTPVNNLMTQTQVLLAKERSAEEYREVLYSNMEEFERLARMIADMLFLAKADNGLIVPHEDQISLSAEVLALFEFYDALAAEKSISLCVEGHATLRGDRLMLRRALSNLLSNAIRHATPGTVVRVDLLQSVDGTRISIHNQGETIAADILPRLFERFFRADASRYRIDEGAGLGLAITRSIVLAHQGDISATSANGMTAFRITFPGSRS